jgi:CBS domain-containing protein
MKAPRNPRAWGAAGVAAARACNFALAMQALPIVGQRLAAASSDRTLRCTSTDHRHGACRSRSRICLKEFAMTQVADVMTRGVRSMSPDDTMQLAAQAMDELNVGVVPVCDGDRLCGMVTDRDIAIRGVAQGRRPESTPLRDVMSSDPLWCLEDEPLEKAIDQMRDAQVRRLPVVDRDRHLVGILSLGDVSETAGSEEVADALASISEPSEPDRSNLSAASGSAGGGAQKGR